MKIRVIGNRISLKRKSKQSMKNFGFFLFLWKMRRVLWRIIMRYYVKVVINGVIDQGVHTFGTLEEAKLFKQFAEESGGLATIYEIELKEVQE